MEDSRFEEITNEDLALFKDALRGSECDSTELRLYTIKKIATLAKVIGPEKTIYDLLEFIDSKLECFEEEVLCGLVEELELFSPLVGGPEHCHEVISILLRICRSVDETLVRTKAVNAIEKLLSEMDQQLIEKFLLTSLLGNTENVWFSEKCTTLSLIPVCYPKASPENKALLRQKYCQIFEDNSTMIRKLAAMSLPEFIDKMEIEHVLKEFVPVLNMIIQDEQEIVRLNAVEVALSIASKSKNQEVRNNMFETIKDQCGDSWKSRQKLAMTINNIADVFSEEDYLDTLILMYESLAKDKETEVRIEAMTNLFKFTESLRNNLSKIENPQNSFEEIFMNSLMPIIASVSRDSSVHLPFSSVILSLSSLIPNEIFKDTLLSVVIIGLEHDYPPQFKENILMNLKYLPKDIDLSKSLTSMKSVVKEIIENSATSWRTRRSLLVSFVSVANFCTAEYFQNNLLAYYILLLKDNVYAVRKAATLIFPILMKRYGVRWFIREVMPQVLDILKSKKYLMRYVVLFCIQELIFPTIDLNKNEANERIYTKELKTLIQKEEKKYSKILCKISSLNRKLKHSLNQDPFKNTIETYTDEYGINSENMRLYAEDILDSIPRKDESIFSIDPNRNEEDMCYLEGVLILLNKTLLNILKSMLDDPVKNIQDRTGYVLTNIRKFCNHLDDEMSMMWVSDCTSKIDEIVWREIDRLMDEEIEEAVINCENADEIDSELRSNISIESLVGSSISNFDVQELDVFPSDPLPPEELHFEEMESLDEEKCKDSNC